MPELQDAWAKHLEEEEGEALPHVFFPDVVEVAADIARRDDATAAARLAKALEAMASSPDPDVVNVIHVSFVEFFVWGGDEKESLLEWLKPFFGPAMLLRIREFEEWADGIGRGMPRRRPRAT